MTITEAIIKVLQKEPQGLSIHDIYQRIMDEKMFDFGAKNPENVIYIQIKRFCDGAEISKKSKEKFFVEEHGTENKIYKLKYCKGANMGYSKKYNFVSANINGITIYTFVMSVADLANISYVAVRGKDEEDGAVQRVLNKSRIGQIKKYVLDNNMFVNTFVLNWTNSSNNPIIKGNEIEFPIICGSAQLIDGQHRLEGIKAAMVEDETISEKNVIVSFAINLPTADVAKIFLNINSEQKPVPKSLIYDLYGVTAEDRNYAINRSNDIAHQLNDDEQSPFYQIIKLPGAPRGKSKLDLSTVVNAIKTYVDRGGKLEENNIKDYSIQYSILCNYFNAIKYHADKTNKWSTISLNIFYKAAGFIGAVEFFFEYVFPKCVLQKSFKEETIAKMFDFSDVELITPKMIETTDGRTARKRVIDNLKDAFLSDIPGESDYEI